MSLFLRNFRIGPLAALAVVALPSVGQTAGPVSTVHPPRAGEIRCDMCEMGLLAPPSLLGKSASAADADGQQRGVALPCEEDGSTIDVLFLYTPNAYIEAGNHPAAIPQVVAFAIQNVNDHLAASSVPGVNFRSVNIRQVTYDEFAGSPSGGLIHLQRLSTPDDGFMDIAHTWRNQDRADLVALIVATGGNFFGGVAWADVTNSNSGFAVCDLLSAQAGTFTHEWGHNLGLFHQCSEFAGGYLRYAQGYLWNHSQSGQPFGTAMVGASDACPRPGNMIYAPLYSNPDLTYLGDPAGVPLHLPNPTHEALAIRETHNAVANFRRSTDLSDCNNNGVNDQTDVINGTSADENQNFRPDECEIRLYVNKNVAQEGDGLTWATARKELVDAMRAAAVPCSNVREIWVAAGTYTPDSGTANRQLHFEFGDSVRVFGGFAGGETLLSQRNPDVNLTVMSGEIGNPGSTTDNTSSVLVGYDVLGGALIDGFTITAGRADIDGGAVYLERSSPTFRDCTFASNTAASSGGAVRLALGGSPRFENCRFVSNSAAGFGGGAIGATQVFAVHVDNCQFETNQAAWGAAIAISDSLRLEVHNCDIEANNSFQYTGAIDLFNTDLVLDATAFVANHATTYGGALTIAAGGSIATLTNCTFDLNTAAQWAGAVAVFDATTLTAGDCVFTDCSALNLGGAMVVAGPTALARLNRCSFDGNGSAQGGGLAVYDRATARLDRCTFLDNHSSGNGGAIDVSFSPTLYLSRSKLLGNVAQLDGGAIFTNNATQTTTVNTVFSGNRAVAGGGGAVGLYQSPLNTFALCTFASNASVASGGALYLWQASATAANCIAWNDMPSEVGLFSGGAASITYSNIQGGFAGAGNISSNPLFISRLGPDALAGTLDDNVQLSTSPAASPSIDAGNAAAIPADFLDVDADANTAEPTPLDLLSFARRIDHPAAANSGAGAPPVDMGAYETPCPGDVNGDGQANLSDLSILLSHFGQIGGATIADGDLSGDGNVNLTDLSLLLSRFGASCL